MKYGLINLAAVTALILIVTLADAHKIGQTETFFLSSLCGAVWMHTWRKGHE